TGAPVVPVAQDKEDEEFNPQPTDYALEKVIATGGFGEIWQATQVALGRPIAVKRLRRDLIDQNVESPATLRRMEVAFRQEALTAAFLEHPNIIPVLGLS